MKLTVTMSFLLISLVICAQYEHPFRDTSISINERVNDLVSRLSLEEKSKLMLYNSPAIERLNVPEYNWWNECLHGVARAGKATVFPQAIGLAATFDDDLIYQVATAISDEARAKHHAAIRMNNRIQYGGLTFWTPNINIFRDPRWGRGMETYGEDPYLTSRIGVSFVRGLQGNHPKYLKTAACAKHFAVHSGPEPLRHHFDALVDNKDLRETYLPAFKELVDAGVETVMCAYNRLNGEPCCGSQTYLVELLRNEWGFKGHVVSDCWALDDIWARHKVKKDEAEAAAMALKAGVNLNCGYIYNHLPEAVERGLITETEIDDVIKVLLKTQFRLGMYDDLDDNPYSKIPETVINSKKNIQLAREVASKSIVLLKNNNNTLPLKKDLSSLYVTGPTAASLDVLMANYNGLSANMVTFLEGVMSKVSNATMVDYRKGTILAGSDAISGVWNAGHAQLTIAFLGISPLLEGEEGDALLSDSNGDREVIRLPENQVELVKQLRETIEDKPLVLVITGGSAVAIQEVAELADAVLWVWYPGEQGGNAVADVLFGNVNPSGKLPVTFYKSENDLPEFENYNMAGHTYKYFEGEPLYPFGFGLSYTTFEYDELNCNQTKFKKDDVIELTTEIKNTGEYDGEEVVQLYVKYPEGVERAPLKQLIDFTKVNIKKGESVKVEFNIEVNKLQLWDLKTDDWKLYSGQYKFLISSSSAKTEQVISVKMK